MICQIKDTLKGGVVCQIQDSYLEEHEMDHAAALLQKTCEHSNIEDRAELKNMMNELKRTDIIKEAVQQACETN